jgi:hypothetical protein
LKTAVFIISLLLAHALFSSDSEWEGIILKKMLHSIATSKEITVYAKDKSLRQEFGNSPFIHIVKSCKNCDFVLVRNDMNLSCKKPAIVFSYYSYLHTPNAVGVFFWQKGRPTIRFSLKRLKHFRLQVRGELSKFVSTHD